MGKILWRQKKVRLAADPKISMHRTLVSPSRLNHISKNLDCRRYLEIGVARGETIEAIDVEYRIGVDPFPLFRLDLLPEKLFFYRMKSDEFFDTYTGDAFHLIFLDGLHEAKQTYRDLINAFKFLDERGFILLDDIWPTDYASSMPNINESLKEKKKVGISHRRWYGDVYKVVSALIHFHPGIHIQIIGNVDSHAQALIWRNKDSGSIEFLTSALIHMENLDYESIFGQKKLYQPWANSVEDKVFYEWFTKWVEENL